MNKIITSLGLAIIGLVITPITVKSLTLQTVTQSAIVDGTNNQVEQNVEQVISDFFSINIDFNNFELNYQNEIYTRVTFEQYSQQEVSIFGFGNQVIQQVNQIQVNFFQVSFNSPQLEDKRLENNNLIIPFLEQFRDLVWNDTSMAIDQFSLQDVFIDGEANEILQTVNQTAIAIFEFDTDLSLNLLKKEVVDNSFYRSLSLGQSNHVTQEIKQTWLDIFLFGTDQGLDNLSLNELISFAQSPHFSLTQSPSYSQLLPTVPEPTAIKSLVALGTFGILLKIYRYFN